MVFQHFGLLPHRKVIDNVAAFGLGVRGEDKKLNGAIGPRRWYWSSDGYENNYPDQALRRYAATRPAWPAPWPTTRR